MNQALEKHAGLASDAVTVVERLITTGDLSKLSSQDRITYYNGLCRSLGLNPFTRPFEYLTLSGELVLYARKDATEQLRKINNVSITKLECEQDGDLYIVTAHARVGDRADMDVGAVSTKGLHGDALVNARLKAVTKAKRRVTLSICGLGFLDETERETIPGATPAPPAVIVPAEGDESLTLEEETELLRQAARDLCSNLNAAGYQPKWTAVALKTYVNHYFTTTGGLDTLSVPQLRELVQDLTGKLEALNTPAESESEEVF